MFLAIVLPGPNTVHEQIAFLSPRLQIAPCTAPYFSLLVQSKVSKRNTPRHTGLRFAKTPLAPALLRGSSRRAILGPSRLIWHPCQMPLYAAPALGLLTGPVRRPKPCCSTEDRKSCRRARTNGPVRRVSGIGVEGVERHGCRESCDGPWRALRSGPLEQRWSERTRNVAQRSAGPYAGRPSFAHFSWANKKSEAPYRAQPVIQTGKRSGLTHDQFQPKNSSGLPIPTPSPVSRQGAFTQPGATHF